MYYIKAFIIHFQFAFNRVNKITQITDSIDLMNHIPENSLDERPSVDTSPPTPPPQGWSGRARKRRKVTISWRMATLNHAKTTAWEAASETMRNKRPPGADISFSISRTSSPFSLFSTHISPLQRPSRVFFSAIFSVRTFIIFKRPEESNSRTSVRLWFTSLDAKSLRFLPFLSSQLPPSRDKGQCLELSSELKPPSVSGWVIISPRWNFL